MVGRWQTKAYKPPHL